MEMPDKFTSVSRLENVSLSKGMAHLQDSRREVDSDEGVSRHVSVARSKTAAGGGEVEVVDLKLSIIRLLDERNRARTPGIATSAQIAAALDEPLKKVLVTLRSAAAIGLLKLIQTWSDRDEDISVSLLGPAYIYLEAAMNSEEVSG
jgi:hypothetical protein